MSEPKTLVNLFDEAVAKHGDQPAVRILRPGDGGFHYEPLTYSQLRALTDQLVAGLHQLGLRKGQRVGILTDGGFEPLLVFLAADRLGLTSVPLCHKSATEILVHNITRSAIEVLFVDDKGKAQYDHVHSALHNPPSLVVTKGEVGDGVAWNDLLTDPTDLPNVEVRPEDESKILYTSGSSGLPKGVVQTHANIVANVLSVWDAIAERESCRMFKSAPDYHSMGILNIYYPLAKGWILDLARSPDRVLNDIRLSEPEVFLTVPLVLDKVFGNVRKEIDAGGIKGKLVDRAVSARRRRVRGEASFCDHLLDATIGGRVVAKIKDQLSRRVGGNLKTLIVGSAKADPEALDFFQDVLGIRTFEGYGTTECAPLIAANHLKGRKVGTVGRALFPVRLVDEDGNALAQSDAHGANLQTDPEAVGELWAAGPQVMREYLNDPEQSARVLITDEQGRIWYRTGDLFAMDAEGYLTFRGRVGRQFKLANGEFVNPELLERILARAPLVEHVLVTGRQEWGLPVFVVTVDVEEAARQTDLGSLPSDDAQLRSFAPLTDRICDQLRREADQASLQAHERPVKIVVLPEALSEDQGTLTRGLRKVVPGAVNERYGELIDKAGSK